MQVFEDLISGWWEYQRLLNGSREQRRALEAGHPAWAYASWIEVTTRVNAGGLTALHLVGALIEAAPGGDASLVGVGPLENLVRRHGNSLAREVARLASGDARFGQALSDVWLAQGTLAPEAEQVLSRWVTVTGSAKRL